VGVGSLEYLKARLRQQARCVRDRTGRVVAVLESRTVSAIAEETGWSLRDVERTALSQDLVPIRYWRNMGLWGCCGQVRLLESRALVAGLGGLGGLATELLARAGVGELVLVDGDRFEESNLNRQLLATGDTVGRSKAVAAAERVRAINPAVQVIPVVGKVEELADELLAGAGVVLDCLDNFPSRYCLQARCRKLRRPLVSAAIGGSMAQVMTVLPGDPGIEALYGPQPPGEGGAELVVGTPPATPAAAASWQAQEAIWLLLGRPPALRRRMLCLDLESGCCEVLSLG